MNMFDEAESIRKMLSMRDMTQAKLAALLGVSQPYVANKLRLLGFSTAVRESITEAGLSERHARTILRLPTESARLMAVARAKEGRMNVARCEIMVDCMLDKIQSEQNHGENYTERICNFERSLISSLSLLRQFGIKTEAKREGIGDKIYFSICIG